MIVKVTGYFMFKSVHSINYLMSLYGIIAAGSEFRLNFLNSLNRARDKTVIARTTKFHIRRK